MELLFDSFNVGPVRFRRDSFQTTVNQLEHEIDDDILRTAEYNGSNPIENPELLLDHPNNIQLLLSKSKTFSPDTNARTGGCADIETNEIFKSKTTMSSRRSSYGINNDMESQSNLIFNVNVNEDGFGAVPRFGDVAKSKIILVRHFLDVTWPTLVATSFILTPELINMRFSSQGSPDDDPSRSSSTDSVSGLGLGNLILGTFCVTLTVGLTQSLDVYVSTSQRSRGHEHFALVYLARAQLVGLMTWPFLVVLCVWAGPYVLEKLFKHSGNVSKAGNENVIFQNNELNDVESQVGIVVDQARQYLQGSSFGLLFLILGLTAFRFILFRGYTKSLLPFQLVICLLHGLWAWLFSIGAENYFSSYSPIEVSRDTRNFRLGLANTLTWFLKAICFSRLIYVFESSFEVHLEEPDSTDEEDSDSESYFLLSDDEDLDDKTSPRNLPGSLSISRTSAIGIPFGSSDGHLRLSNHMTLRRSNLAVESDTATGNTQTNLENNNAPLNSNELEGKAPGQEYTEYNINQDRLAAGVQKQIRKRISLAASKTHMFHDMENLKNDGSGRLSTEGMTFGISVSKLDSSMASSIPNHVVNTIESSAPLETNNFDESNNYSTLNESSMNNSA